MKKILFSLLLILSLFLTSCGNENLGWGSYSFHYVHIQMYGDDPIHLEVKSWTNDNGGIELKTENYGAILLGDGTYMMYDSNECPLCGEVNYK